MNKCKGDFGGSMGYGVTYSAGDFHTNGTLAGPRPVGYHGDGLGDLWSDLSKTLFGEQGAQQVATTLQQGATATLTNVVGRNIQQDPNAALAVQNTALQAAGAIWQQYKWPIIAIGGGLMIMTALGLYNTYKQRK